MPEIGTQEAPASPEYHYVVTRGLLHVAGTEKGKSLAYPPGAVLPDDIGRQEAVAHPWAVRAMPGRREPSTPVDPNGGGMPMIRQPAAGMGLTDEDVRRIAAVVSQEARAAGDRFAVQDSRATPEMMADRERVRRESEARADRRRKERERGR